MKPSRNLCLASILAFTVVPAASAAPIIWDSATTISADTQVLTAGSLTYGYLGSNAATTINGVNFAASGKTSGAPGSWGSVTLSSGFSGTTTTSFSNPAGVTANLTKGGTYGGTGVGTVTLNSLTSGHVYATQIWVNDSRVDGGRTETVTSTGGNTVTLDYNSTGAVGGAGQFTIGRFAASGTTQAFTMQGNASTQLNAIQVRDVTNIGNWVGTGGATWDASTTNNFASNLFSAALATTNFGAAKAPLSSVTFADSYWNAGAATTVTQTTVSIASAGVSTGTVYFDNSAVNYTIGNASGTTGITSSTMIVKNGSGSVTLNGVNTHTGGTIITAGTLKTGVAGALSAGNTALTITGGTLDLNGVTAAQQVSAFNGSGGTVLNSVNSTTGYLIVGGNNLGGTYSGTIADNAGGGATGKVSLGKVGSGTQILSTANTYSGGTTITGGTIQMDHANALGTTGTIAFDGPASGTLSILKWGTGITTDLSSRITVNAAKTAVLNTTNDVNFANALTFTSGTGDLYKEGAGKLTLNSGFTMRRMDINAGTLKVAAGTYNLGAYFTVNTSGTAAAYEQSGGTVNLTTNNGAYIGNAGTPASSFTLSGGAFNVGTTTSTGSEGIIMRAGGTSTMTVSGAGTLTNTYTTNTTSGGLQFSKTSGTTANFNLGAGTGTFSGGSNILDGGTSGTLSVNRIVHTSGNANFNFDGGTLKATMNNSSFFGSASINAYVKDAGGIIDNNGNAIGMSQVFQHGGVAATDGGLVFKGAGTTTLTGASSFTGKTTIDGGTLALGTGGSINNSSGVNLVNNGHFNVSTLTSYSVASLTGNGSVTGDLTVTGSLGIGASPGTVTFNDDLTLGGSSISTFEINSFGLGQYDLATSGIGSQTVTLGGSLVLNFLSGFNTTGTVQIFNFENYSGSFNLPITTNGLALGYTATFNSASGFVTVVPEPRAAILGLLGTLGLLRRRR